MASIFGLVKTALPSKGTESTNKQARVTAYGDQYHAPIFTPQQAQAWEGSRFTAMATPVVAGTGVVLGSFPTVYSDTLKIAVCITNSDAAGGKSIILDYLRARVIVADTNGTSLTARCEVDSTNRFSSGGTSLTVANALPGANAPAAVGVIRVGDVTCAAAGTYRTHLGHTLIKKRSAPTLTVDDNYVFTFGGAGSLTANGQASQLITGLTSNIIPFGPAVIPAGGSFMLQLAIPAGDTTPAQMCWDAAWCER